MKDKKKAVLSATEVDVRRYICRKKYWLKVLFFAGVVMLASLYVVVSHAVKVGWYGYLNGGSIAALWSWFISLDVILFFDAGTKTTKSQLLKRWEKVTYQSAADFPTSSYLVAGLRGWAEEELRREATWANSLFVEQRKRRAAHEELKKRQVSPTGISHHKLEVAGSSEKLRDIDKRTQYRYQRFLSLWDLVTDKFEGIGILTGPKWQNPERFLNNLDEKIEFVEIK